MELRQTHFVPSAPFLVAEATGLFTDLSVYSTVTQSSREQRDELLADRQDLAITAMDNVIAWNAAGGDFRILAQIERTTALSLHGRPDLDGLQALRGGRLLVDAPDSGFVIVLQNMLLNSGVGPGDYTLIRAGGVRERLEALAAGQGDATLLGPPFADQADDMGMIRLAEVQAMFPDFPGQGVVARASTLIRLETPLRAYITALQSGLRTMNDHPDEAEAHIVAAGLPRRAAQAMLAAGATTLRPSLAGLQLLLHLRESIRALIPSSSNAAALTELRFLPSQ